MVVDIAKAVVENECILSWKGSTLILMWQTTLFYQVLVLFLSHKMVYKY